jgi:ribosomal protein S18 acetylase RimI-like enzyme
MSAKAPSVRIERLTLADLPAALAIQREVYPGELIEGSPAFASRIQLPDSYCLAARIGPLIGYLLAHGWLADTPPKLNEELVFSDRRDVMYIHDLGVSPSCRDLGVGRALVERALAMAASDGLREAQLIAVQGADRFWRRLDFSEGAASPQVRAKLRGYGDHSIWMTRKIN